MSWKQPQALIVAASVVVLSLFDGGSSPLCLAILSVVTWGCVLGGLVWRMLPTAEISRQGLLAASGFVLLAVLSGISAAWAADQGRAVEEAVRWSAYSGVFVLVLLSGSDPTGRARWLQGLAIGLGLVVILAIISRVWPAPFPTPESRTTLFGSTYRWSYPLGYWNALGLFAAIAAVSLSSLAVGSSGLGRLARAMSAGTAALAVGVLAMTGSRGATLACAIGFFALVALSPQRRRQFAAVGTALLGGAILYLVADLLGLTTAGVFGRGLERALLGAATAVIFSLSLIGWLALDLLVPRGPLPRRFSVAAVAIGCAVVVALLVAINPVERIGNLTEPPGQGAFPGTVEGGLESGNGRWQLWGSAVDAFAFRPVAGLGAGGFEEWWAAGSSIDLFARNAHSLPIGVLAELGVIGGCLVLLIFTALVWVAVLGSRQGLHEQLAAVTGITAVTVVGSLFDWSWTVPAAFAPGVAAAALLAGYGVSRVGRPESYRLGLVAMPVAWVAIAVGVLIAAGEVRLAQSRSAASGGDYALAAERASDAHTMQPWSGAPYLQGALVAEAAGRPRDALRLLSKAKSKDSEDWRIYLIEYRIQSSLMDEAAARAARSEALLLYPRLGRFEDQGGM